MRVTKKAHFIIISMCLLLAILVARLFMSNQKETENDKNQIVFESMEELKAFVEVENRISGGKAVETVSEQSETLPSYANLYPELYAEPLKEVSQKKEGEKIAYLTFDDGPSKNTCDVLDILSEKGIKATFFIVGETITEEGKECLKQMAEDGHTIGLHTYSHNYKKLYASVESFLEDYAKLYEMIYEITGIKPNIFRFPGGSSNNFVKRIKKEVIIEMKRRGFTFYDWNVSAEDSVGKPTAYSIMKNIRKDYQRFHYPVLLMHDAELNSLTVSLLPDIISELKETGYTFDTLDHREPCQFSW